MKNYEIISSLSIRSAGAEVVVIDDDGRTLDIVSIDSDFGSGKVAVMAELASEAADADCEGL